MLKPLKQAIKGLLEQWRRRRNAAERSQTERHVYRAELVAGLRGLGVQPGDTLFIHSSLKSLGFVVGGPSEVIAALQEAVGPEGSLLLPTYYLPAGTIHATCELPDYRFDIRRHGTNMGRLPEAFLATPGVERSLHPTHSVSAWGQNARFLTEAHHLAPSVFGPGSPWARLMELDRAKVLGLGINMGPVTFYHLLEDLMGVDFPLGVWQDKTYELPCIDAEGRTWPVPVRPYRPEMVARRIDNRSREDLRQFYADAFDRSGLRRKGRVGEAESWIIEAPAFLAQLRQMAGQGLTIYASPEQLAAAADR